MEEARQYSVVMGTYIHFFAGALLLITGIVVAFLLYPVKRMCGYIESYVIRTAIEEEVEVYSNSEERVEFLVHHNIYIWNGGNIALTREDMADGWLARVGLPSGIQVILEDYGLVGRKICASVEKRGEAYILKADRLDKGQGIWLHLVEPVSKKRKSGCLSLSAHILGAGDLITRVEARPINRYLHLLLRPLRAWTVAIVAVIVLYNWVDNGFVREVGLLGLGFYVLLFWFEYIGFLRGLQASVRFRVPNGFDQVWRKYGSTSVPETARNLSL